MNEGFTNPEYERRLGEIEKRLDAIAGNVLLLIVDVKHAGNVAKINTDELVRIGTELEKLRK